MHISFICSENLIKRWRHHFLISLRFDPSRCAGIFDSSLALPRLRTSWGKRPNCSQTARTRPPCSSWSGCSGSLPKGRGVINNKVKENSTYYFWLVFGFSLYSQHKKKNAKSFRLIIHSSGTNDCMRPHKFNQFDRAFRSH